MMPLRHFKSALGEVGAAPWLDAVLRIVGSWCASRAVVYRATTGRLPWRASRPNLVSLVKPNDLAEFGAGFAPGAEK